MFFKSHHFQSMNEVYALSDGDYASVVRHYQNAAGSFSVFLQEFKASGASAPCAYDLIIVLASGDILFRDFLLLADGDWRDSYGARSTELVELLPPELQDMRLTDVELTYFHLCGGVPTTPVNSASIH